MTSPTQMRELFEGTMPPDEQILSCMAIARMRRVRRRRRAQTASVSVVAALTVCGVFLLGTLQSGDPNNIEVRAERPSATPSLTSVPLAERELVVASGEEALAAHFAVAPSLPHRHEAPPRSVPTASSAASWRAVAEAMRAGDDLTARRLLQQLSNSEDAVMRDNARLVQLRSALANADSTPPSSEQLAQLQQLATSGATASIRASARRLLDTVR